MRPLLAALAILVLGSWAGAVRYRIDTFAGNGQPGTADDVGDGLPATAASLSAPAGLARDHRGDIYVADHGHGRVRRLHMRGGVRTITTVAGSGQQGFGGDGGPATAAALGLPTGVAFTRDGQLLVVDAGTNTVRRVDGRGIIHTFAGRGDEPPGDAGDGGPADQALLDTPLRAAIARNGDVYLAELNTHRVRVVRRATGDILPVAGTGTAGDTGDEGPAVAALLDGPAGIVLGPHGAVIIADYARDRLRVVTADGIIHALAGTGIRTGSIDGEGGDPRDDLGDGGPAAAATFSEPTGIALDAHGGLLVADQGNSRIRRIARDASGAISPGSIVTTIVGSGEPGYAGDGGDALEARLLIPTDVLLLPRGRLLVSDRGNDRVRIVVPVADDDLCSARCSDANPCTTDTCDAALGCEHTPTACKP
jgi:DNA-binding beta-propeller fold protein YncE